MTRVTRLLWLLVALAFAAGTGYLAATAIGQTGQEPTRTVTVNVATGPRGPEGPPGPVGPVGPAGGDTCPAGFSHGIVVINAPGGQVTLFTCLKD